ncbi:hypothetical protein DFH06DRAFT_1358254 [Mycena polygramma]|nr:hypothetical protein DFH06DRAFT_1358254 [Mycena polygramma]
MDGRQASSEKIAAQGPLRISAGNGASTENKSLLREITEDGTCPEFGHGETTQSGAIYVWWMDGWAACTVPPTKRRKSWAWPRVLVIYNAGAAAQSFTYETPSEPVGVCRDYSAPLSQLRCRESGWRRAYLRVLELGYYVAKQSACGRTPETRTPRRIMEEWSRYFYTGDGEETSRESGPKVPGREHETDVLPVRPSGIRFANSGWSKLHMAGT